MTRNELKLEIWNRLNVCPLTEKQVDALKNELDEEELGIFVDLFCDYLPGPAFIRDERHKEELQKLFEDLTPIKQMTEKYSQMRRIDLMGQMRNRLMIDYLDDNIKCLTELRTEIAKNSGADSPVFDVIGRILDYVRFLRAKADTPAIDGLDKAEALMLEVIVKEEDNWVLHMVASLLCLFADDISDVDAAVRFFDEKKACIEQYARFLQQELNSEE